jgi:hypothetical protein
LSFSIWRKTARRRIEIGHSPPNEKWKIENEKWKIENGK